MRSELFDRYGHLLSHECVGRAGPMSMPSASTLSSRAKPNSSTRVFPAEANGIAWTNRGLGFDVDDQAIEASALLNTSRPTQVTLQHWRVDRVNRDDTSDFLTHQGWFCAVEQPRPRSTTSSGSRACPVADRGDVQVKGWNLDASQHGAMSGRRRSNLRLRRYMTTGSSCSDETTSSLMLRMISTTSPVNPDCRELMQHTIDADAGTAAPGIDDSGVRRASSRVCSRIRLKRFKK